MKKSARPAIGFEKSSTDRGNLTKAGSETCARDAFGRAISSTSGTKTTDYLFDGLEVIQEQVGANAPTYYTRGLGDQLISRRGGGDPLRYYHHDAIGSVVALTNGAGDLTDTYDYIAFGMVWDRTGTNSQPFTYLGNAYDSTIRLHDYDNFWRLANDFDHAVEQPGLSAGVQPVSLFAPK